MVKGIVIKGVAMVRVGGEWISLLHYAHKMEGVRTNA
jgi:hypothetical protein